MFSCLNIIHICVFIYIRAHTYHMNQLSVYLSHFPLTAIAQERQQSVHSYISLYRYRFFHFHCCFDQGFGKMLS